VAKYSEGLQILAETMKRSAAQARPVTCFCRVLREQRTFRCLPDPHNPLLVEM
jgi:hypothetical protein